ncbi:MAG: LptA/OstA family protein, partial [Verrucomicrobiota bacterium]
GSVQVLSGAMQMTADTMRIEAKKGVESSGEAESEEISVGAVEKVVAEGSVTIERDEQTARAQKVVFYPATERAQLLGQPVIENGDAKIEGFRMELQPKGAHVQGNEEQMVVVTLPEMPDLGYDPLSGENVFPQAPILEAEPQLVTESEVETAPAITTIRSEDLQVTDDVTGMFFVFSESVLIEATNLEATCDLLEVRAERKEGSGINALEVDTIDAIDNVRFVQSGRTATANKAMIRPLEGKVTLEGDAAIFDDRGKVTGHRMILNQGERRAIVEGDGTNRQRAKITLPALPTKKP